MKSVYKTNICYEGKQYVFLEAVRPCNAPLPPMYCMYDSGTINDLIQLNKLSPMFDPPVSLVDWLRKIELLIN